MPVVGFLNFTSPDGFDDRLRAFRQGLRDTGYVEGAQRGDRIPLGRELIRSIARALQPNWFAVKSP